jgi:hypothetical protein
MSLCHQKLVLKFNYHKGWQDDNLKFNLINIVHGFLAFDTFC